MKIHNFRAGFATNSSSSHSVILLPPNKIGKVRGIPVRQQDSYGWDHFRLVTEEDKLRYLAAQLFLNYARDIPALHDVVARIDQEVPGYAAEMAEQIRECETTTESYFTFDAPSVDHQSTFTLPKKYDPDLVNGLIRYFRSPRVVVLGGNDNADSHPNKVSNSEVVSLFNHIRDRGDAHMVSRSDGHFWVIFSKHNGNKMRFSFDNDDLNASDYNKSTAPELVDVKITDWCDKGCNFCYQSSTTKGVHASLDRIEAIAAMLGEMRVFEVALGGGEPTAHPKFKEILNIFGDYGIVPNFTTFSDRWINNPLIVETVKRHVGGIGVSCLSTKDLDLVNKIRTAFGRGFEGKILAQHVVGSVPYQQTVDFIKAASDSYLSILLLGYKDVGFGAIYERFDDDNFETYLKLAIDDIENRWIGLSVDTALINRYPNVPRILGAPEALVTSREGAFSCYIDATTNLIGASSYVQPSEMKPLPNNVDDFLKLYATF